MFGILEWDESLQSLKSVDRMHYLNVYIYIHISFILLLNWPLILDQALFYYIISSSVIRNMLKKETVHNFVHHDFIQWLKGIKCVQTVLLFFHTC